MATKFARSEDFKTETSRLLYAYNLFKVRKDETTGRERFGCTLIFPNSYKPSLEKVVAGVIVEQWGEKGLERARQGLIRSPFLAGDSKEARSKKTGEFNAGLGDPNTFFIRPTANPDHPPVVRYRSANIPATEEEVYSGCRGFAVLNAFAWNHVTNGDGVSFGIQYFQKTGDDEKLGGSGGVDPEKWHEKIEDTGAAPSSTQNGAGAGGLFG